MKSRSWRLAAVGLFAVAAASLPAGCRTPPSDHAARPETSASPSGEAATARAAAPPSFTDVTRAAGIRFTATSSRTPSKYMVETMGSGGGFIDYDNDGDQDILLLNGAPLPGGAVPAERPTPRLYRNNGDGTFADVTKKAGLDATMYAMGCAVGDYDNDGYDDVYVTCALGPSRLYRNNGDGTYADVTRRAGVDNAGLWGTSCAWLDADNDGHLDLFVCNYVVYRTLKDDIPCYSGEGKRSYCIPSAFQPSRCVLYRNNGDGMFADVSRAAGIEAATGKSLGIAVHDYDGDGLPDIFVANDTTAGFLFHNLGGMKFEELGVQSGLAYDEQGNPHSGMGIDVADLYNDGSHSMVLTNYSLQQISLYNLTAPAGGPGSPPLYRDDKLPSGVGAPSTSYLGFGASFFDYDNDGLRDIFVANGHVQDDIEEHQPGIRYAEEPFLYRNQGDRTFREVGIASGEPFTNRIVARAAARGDYDNDGRVDVLLTTNNGPAYLWRNTTSTPNHYLTLKLVGTRSNRSGIGAVVTARAGGVTRTWHVRSGSSYLSANDLRAHFGLGDATNAEVEVRWPSGTVDRIPSAPTDRFWTLTEGSATLR